MAIRIPILTSFDPKGLKQANAQFAKLQTSMGSLGRNFAAAGVVIAGAFTLIGKSVMDAAESQKVFAQTEAVLKSTGTTANGTAVQIASLASALQKSTAFNDEAILSGANLLLTFKNIQNQAGAGNDIFDQTAKAMLDVARAMGTDASGEAIRLGKALNDPVKGISALTRVGIQFTDQQKAQIKALSESGDLLGAQKIILAELNSQFGGSAATYAKTFSGQLEGMNNELNDLSEEIGMMVMPAVTGLIAELKALIPVIGPQLKAAIASVDFKALAKSVVDFTTFLIQNGEAIVKTIAVIFAISTAYKAMAVAIGIAKVATAVYTWAVAQAAAGMTIATLASGVLRVALLALPWVAVAAGIGLIVAGMTEVDSSYRTTTPVVTSFGQTMLKSGQDAVWAAGKYGIAADAINKVNNAAAGKPKAGRTSVLDDYAFNLKNNAPVPAPTVPQLGTPAITTSGGGSKTQTMSLGETLKREAAVVRKQTKLIGAGVSEGLAARITSGSAPIKRANKVLASITKNNGKLTKGLKRMERNLKVANQETVEVIQDTSVADALAEKERVYASFADSVKNTFAGIKNSIMGAFDITQLGGSTDSITRNMDKMLVKLRAFSNNVKSLASMGLNSALLQQVISAGPMAGAQLAANLVAGGAGALSAINAGYTEFGSLSSQIAQTGTEAMFNTAGQQSIYNISVNGGVGSGATIGAAIVDAIKAYERTSGAVWQGA